MDVCEICHNNDRSNLLTRCCQLFICYECRDKYDRMTVCSCGKTTGKKWCEPEPRLYQTLQEYFNNKAAECSRCDSTDKLQYCCECEIELCIPCFQEMHAVGIYKEHVVIERNNTRRVLQQKKISTNVVEQLCSEHRLKKQYVCECNMSPICSVCLRLHRETCGKKYKGLSDFKNEYFSMMLNKLDVITDYKEQLRKSTLLYKQNFERQKKVYESTEQYLRETFSNLEKLLEFKKAQSLNSLSKYWTQCCSTYDRVMSGVDACNRQYDDYGRLVQKLAGKMIGLDYLDKHINLKMVDLDIFSFKVIGLEQLEKQILSLTTSNKKWENATQLVETGLRARKASTLNIQTPQMLSQIHEQPLLPRPIKLITSNTEIQYQFLHLPYQKGEYEIEFGVGMKTKGQEVFKKIKGQPNGKGIIKNLNPQTIYRVRMRVVGGIWGNIYEVATLPTPSFMTNCTFAKGDNKGNVQFLKGGSLYSSNPIEFGVHSWQVRLTMDKNSHTQSDTACLSIGVSNKQSKKALFIGTTINYGYQRDSMKMKVTVDCQNNRMTIVNDKQQQEVYQNLPEFPFYPTLVNKGNSTIQLAINFL